MQPRCEMGMPHHPDCECALCLAHEDPVCGREAVAIVGDGRDQYPVCRECAAMVEDDPEAYGHLTYAEAPGGDPR